MRLTEQQLLRLHLANGVDLPPNYPTPGTISLNECDENSPRIVCIEESDTCERVIRRFVRLDQVIGVFPARTVDGQEVVSCNDINEMLTGDELLSTLQENELRGTAVVQETASVLLQIEMSVGAEESQLPLGALQQIVPTSGDPTSRPREDPFCPCY